MQVIVLNTREIEDKHVQPFSRETDTKNTVTNYTVNTTTKCQEGDVCVCV